MQVSRLIRLTQHQGRSRRLTAATATALLAATVAAILGTGRPATATKATRAATVAKVTKAVPTATATVPRPDHVVVVVFENHAASRVIGNSAAPYLDTLARGGANLTRFYAETHPSQPNYFAMFSGSTQGVTDDSCPPPGAPFSAPNLAQELIAKGRTWASYNEGLPARGSAACTSAPGKYARKHNPWFSFSNVPAATGRTFARFPRRHAALPTVSFVVPNLCDDMHDCPVGTGDAWLKSNLGDYARWARTHNSLLVVTFDEDDWLAWNRIPTIIYGAHVRPGSSAKRYDHYNLLRTIEDMYGTAHAGNAAKAAPITGIWR